MHCFISSVRTLWLYFNSSPQSFVLLLSYILFYTCYKHTIHCYYFSFWHSVIFQSNLKNDFTFIYTIPSSLCFFVKIQISVWYLILSAWRSSFNISFSIGLLAMDSLFLFVLESPYLHFFLENHFLLDREWWKASVYIYIF